jgi:hypothetical protein
MVKEIILKRGQIALVDDEDYERVNKLKWYAEKRRNTFYARAYNPITRKPIRMHRFILNPKNNERIDHINNNGLDGRRCNMRIATNAQNLMNVAKRLNGSSSKYKGVYWYKRYNKWGSHIGVDGKTIHLGFFINEIDAAHAYDNAAKRLFGGYAWLNFNF